MHYFAFNISKQKRDSVEEVLGAAGCWINLPVYDRSLLAAEKMIAGQGWKIEETLAERIVSDSDYAADDEMLRYYQQALIDEEVLVLFLPKSSDDGSAG